MLVIFSRSSVSIFFLAFFFSSILLTGQNLPVGLSNPSFEDIPQHSKPPIGWFYCGQAGESPPDVHPTGMFNVQHDPFEGNTYVGMVVRDNGTWEGIGQRLTATLIAGQCYTFSLFAARSSTYASYSKMTGQAADYTEPVILKIWAGQHNCDGKTLLGQSPKIISTNWEKIDFQFQADQDYTHFFIEAYYNSDGNDRPYNGNVLIDNASPLIPIDCETQNWLVDVDTMRFNLGSTEPSKEELEALITNAGQQISFDKYDELDKQLVQIGDNSLRFTNKHLWKIAKALKARPRSKILIVVRGDNPYAMEQRKSNIARLFEDIDIYPSVYNIKTFKESHLKKKWLWPATASPVLMNLLK